MQAKHWYHALFKRSDFSDIDEMMACVRQLVPEQRLVFDQIMCFAKASGLSHVTKARACPAVNFPEIKNSCT